MVEINKFLRQQGESTDSFEHVEDKNIDKKERSPSKISKG
jgi:hypothetical protein